MFDYQAGEKQKLTLIMVGFAGLMAGMLFTMILMPPAEPPKRRAYSRHMDDPDVTGRPRQRGQYGAAQAAVNATPQDPAMMMDKTAAQSLIQNWLTPAWDLSAGSAKNSQETAMQYMTAECQQAYRQSVWTPEMAKMIEESGLQSSFELRAISTSDQQPDGSVVVFVKGLQTLNIPNKGVQPRAVSMEYLVRQTPAGPRIAGISESGSSG